MPASTSVDILPPYGRAELRTRGSHADELAWLALLVVVLLAYLRFK